MREQWLDLDNRPTTYSVPPPYHGERATLYYVVEDRTGDPIHSYDTEPEAAAAAARLNAKL